MIQLSRIVKDYRDSGAVHTLFNIQTAVSDEMFVTKSGDLLVFLQVHGIDDSCLDDSQREEVTRRFGIAARGLREQFRLTQYLLKSDCEELATPTYSDPVVQAVVQGRRKFFAIKPDPPKSIRLYMAITYGGWREQRLARRSWRAFLSRSGLRKEFSTSVTMGGLEEELTRAIQSLRQATETFRIQLHDLCRAEVLDKNAAFRFLRRLVHFDVSKADAVSLRYDEHVDFQLCDAAIECYRDHLRVGDYYVQVLALKDPPPHTRAHLFRDLLSLPANATLATHWKQEPPDVVRRQINSNRRHQHNSKYSLLNHLPGTQTPVSEMLTNESAVSLVQQLGRAQEESEVHGRVFGHFSLYVLLYDLDPLRLKRSVAETIKVFGKSGAQIVEERFNLLNAYLTFIAGNQAYDLRSLWLSDANYADLSLLFKPQEGSPTSSHLGAEYIAPFETSCGTPYRFNLHSQDVGHTAILGATGSGKSVLVNFLLTHAQKYAPRTTIFDLGGSYEKLAQRFGGAHLRLDLGLRTIPINPFRLPWNEETRQFLPLLLRVLVEGHDYSLTAADERELYEQTENLYAVEPAQRTLGTLANMLNRTLQCRLYKWVAGGPYSKVFDNADDELTFSNLQSFDLEGMDKTPQVLEAFLFYVLHRASHGIEDAAHAGQLKLFVVDEAWRFLRHPAIRSYLLKALKTWRKKNAAVILATQSSQDLLASDLLSVVNESCPTKIFLANPDIDRKLYRETFHLNDIEARRIAELVPKRDLLIKRPEGSVVVKLELGPEELSFYTHHSASSPIIRPERSPS